MTRPLYVYDNWSTYDELSDAVPLTEELALFQLEQVKRLKSFGVKFDAYLMDAYWYDPNGGYLTWRPDRWPNGPEEWLARCAKAGLKPGLWFPANTCFTLNPPESWKESLASDGWGFCCFDGGFMAGFMEVLRYWYGRGVRVFKFDFAEFGAATDAVKSTMLPAAIRTKNIDAYRSELRFFLEDCPEAVLLGYNGFEDAEFMPWTDRPVRPVIDPEWLTIFETVYCGDPRPADLPLQNFWRTIDVYADHEVRYLNLGGLPLNRIDNCALMLGPTDTCYKRGSASWQTTWLLSYARGGKVHVTMGDLSAISDQDARWVASVQLLYENAHKGVDGPKWVGGLPGKGELYGYEAGGVTTLVNPSLSPVAVAGSDGIFYEENAARSGRQGSNEIVLGPGGVVVIQLGAMESLLTSESLALRRPLSVEWVFDGASGFVEFQAERGELHFGFRQVGADGLAVRSTTGSGPGTASLGSVLKLSASSALGALPVELSHDRVIWSGISWAYGVVRVERDAKVRLEISSSDPAVTALVPFLYFAPYQGR
jgi:hypothetical protein